MSTLTLYQQLIEQILSRHADPDDCREAIVTEAIFDHLRSRYVS